MDFKTLLDKEEYRFIHDNRHLGSKIILLGVCGSYGYGTNVEESDIDLRGITLNSVSDLIGMTEYEQFVDTKTDTVIYSFKKLVSLLLNCNPNTIEILGLDDDQYLIRTPVGQELLDNSHLFLTKRAAYSFGHYADAQLRRIQNATARDTLPQPSVEEHILRSATYALKDFNSKQREKGGSEIDARLYIGDAQTKGLGKEIYIEADIQNIPLRSYNIMMKTLNSVVKEYDRIGRRNNKKDDAHLNKHAMHLVRLFMMGLDILGKGEIRTHRPDSDLRLLMDIRRGKYMEGGVLSPEFYEIVTDYEKRFQEAEKGSRLPDEPDMEAINRFVENVNRRIVTREIG